MILSNFIWSIFLPMQYSISSGILKVIQLVFHLNFLIWGAHCNFFPIQYARCLMFDLPSSRFFWLLLLLLLLLGQKKVYRFRWVEMVIFQVKWICIWIQDNSKLWTCLHRYFHNISFTSRVFVSVRWYGCQNPPTTHPFWGDGGRFPGFPLRGGFVGSGWVYSFREEHE